MSTCFLYVQANSPKCVSSVSSYACCSFHRYPALHSRSLNHHVHDLFPSSIPSSHDPLPNTSYFSTCPTLAPLRRVPYLCRSYVHLQTLARPLLHRRPKRPQRRRSREHSILERRIYLARVFDTVRREPFAAAGYHRKCSAVVDDVHGYTFEIVSGWSSCDRIAVRWRQNAVVSGMDKNA